MQPLSDDDCAQCHFSIYQKIKVDGGKHKIACKRCHTQYHAFSSRKLNYDDIMPKCASCHKDAQGNAFHGADPSLANCLECHADPHQPLAMPMDKVEPNCQKCHLSESKEMADYPSQHASSVSCSDCHADKHGFIPECSACHESHSPDVEMDSKACMTCHPVHKPKQIAYDKATRSVVCAGCHRDVYDMLQKNVTKHTATPCAACHPNHKELEPCSTCHGEPHSSAMMRDTTKCRDCHGLAHNLAAN
ncbi:MAG: hypothetical protein AB7E47_00635 [Desulfovibrionaceae bacterium]